jgi:hypothetical protein
MAIQPYPKAYPNGWEDLPSTASPFTASAMNTIDGGVKANRDLLIANELNFLSAVPTGSTTLSLLKGMGANTERHYYTNTALSDFPTSDNDLWYLQLYKVDSSNLSYSDIILRDKTTGKNYVGTASNSAITWHEVGSGEGNAVLVELTWAEYQALSPAEKMNGNLYAITDHDTSVPTTMAAANVSFNKTNTSLNAVTAQDGISESSKARDMLAKVEKTGHATEPYTAGQYVVSNNVFRKVTSAIASGNTISNSNSQETTVGAEISRINADLSEGWKLLGSTSSSGYTTINFADISAYREVAIVLVNSTRILATTRFDKSLYSMGAVSYFESTSNNVAGLVTDLTNTSAKIQRHIDVGYPNVEVRLYAVK